MSFEWFVSKRYLRAKRKQKFISLISIISILGVAVGVMALIVVLSVYTGFTEGLRDQIIGINSHILVQRYGYNILEQEELTRQIESIQGVEATTPYIFSQVLISSGQNSSGVVLRGIDPGLTVEGKRRRIMACEKFFEYSRKYPHESGIRTLGRDVVLFRSCHQFHV